MPYYVVQHGSAVSILDTAGAITAVTLPTGVTIPSTYPPRRCLGQGVIMVNLRLLR
jgi:hypothetical protein